MVRVSFVTVVDLEEDVPNQPSTIGSPAVRTRSTSDKTDLEHISCSGETWLNASFSRLWSQVPGQ